MGGGIWGDGETYNIKTSDHFNEVLVSTHKSQ